MHGFPMARLFTRRANNCATHRFALQCLLQSRMSARTDLSGETTVSEILVFRKKVRKKYTFLKHIKDEHLGKCLQMTSQTSISERLLSLDGRHVRCVCFD